MSPAKTRKLSRCSASHGGGNICLFCDLYMKTLDEVAAWAIIIIMPAWLPVHVRVMLNLQHKHPDIYNQC